MTRPPAFRIGFWCAYGETLLPQTGIGVFAYELIDALLQNHPEVEVCVAFRAGDGPLLAEFAGKHPGRIRLLGHEHPDALRAKARAERDREFPARYARATRRPRSWFARLRSLRNRPRTPGLIALVLLALPLLIAVKLLGWMLILLRLRHRAWLGRAEAPVILPFDLHATTEFELTAMQPGPLADAAGCDV